MHHVRHDDRIPQTFMLGEQVMVVRALLLVDKRCWLVWGIPNPSIKKLHFTRFAG